MVKNWYNDGMVEMVLLWDGELGDDEGAEAPLPNTYGTLNTCLGCNYEKCNHAKKKQRKHIIRLVQNAKEHAGIHKRRNRDTCLHTQMCKKSEKSK